MYKYSRDTVSKDIVFGDRILIRPSTVPCSDKYIQCATLLQLYGPNPATLVGPFSFALINESNRTRQRIPSCEWTALARVCNAVGILPPSLGESKQKPHALCSSIPARRKRKIL